MALRGCAGVRLGRSMQRSYGPMPPPCPWRP